MCIHEYNAVTIILSEWMAVIWHESLFHVDEKSRDTQNLRFIFYIWPHVPSTSRNRTKGRMDDVVR